MDRLWILLRCFIEDYTKIEDQENWGQLIRWWEQDKTDVAVRIAMARHLILQGDRVQEAAQDLESLLVQAPDSVAAIASLLEYYLNIDSRSLDRADTLAQSWPESYRFHAYWRYLGQILEQRSDDSAAIDAYRRALALRPDHGPSLQAISTLLTRAAKATADEAMLEEGAIHAKQLVQVTQTQSGAQELLRRLLEWLRDWNEAAAGSRAVPDAKVIEDVAAFYDRLGRQPESRRWREVLEELRS
jgi:tetratricopeptide (TPR) repeat protein